MTAQTTEGQSRLLILESLAKAIRSENLAMVELVAKLGKLVESLKDELREAATWNHRVRHLGVAWEECQNPDCVRWRDMTRREA